MEKAPAVANYYYIDTPLLRMLCTPYVPDDLLWEFPTILSNCEAASMLPELAIWAERVLTTCCLAAVRWTPRVARDIGLREGDLCFLEESMRAIRVGWWQNRDTEAGTLYRRTTSTSLNLSLDPKWVTGAGAAAALARGNVDVAGLFLVQSVSDSSNRHDVCGLPVVLGIPVPQRNLLGASFKADPICRLVAAERGS